METVRETDLKSQNWFNPTILTVLRTVSVCASRCPVVKVLQAHAQCAAEELDLAEDTSLQRNTACAQPHTANAEERLRRNTHSFSSSLSPFSNWRDFKLTVKSIEGARAELTWQRFLVSMVTHWAWLICEARQETMRFQNKSHCPVDCGSACLV